MMEKKLRILGKRGRVTVPQEVRDEITLISLRSINFGFRIFDSRNGLFVKEPERTYIKDGTELSQSVFFPITKEAREKLYGQILHSYDMVMDPQQAQVQDEGIPFVTDDDAPSLREEISPEDDLPFGEMTM